MSPSYVVDASVAVKWVLNEPDSSSAMAVLDDYTQGRNSLAAPRLLVYEVGNILWRRNRRGEISDSQSERLFRHFLGVAPALIDDESLAVSALLLAQAHGRTLYDSQYLALALSMACPLLTADLRLYNSLRAALPGRLQLLGDNAEL